MIDNHLDMENSCITQHFNDYIRGAARRNYIFTLTYEQFKTIVLQPCNYCTCVASIRRYGFSAIAYNGIDRIDNAMGYTLENCVPCCWQCNRIKNARTLEAFQRLKKVITKAMRRYNRPLTD